MTRITIVKPVRKRTVEEVMGVPNRGASQYGSTFYKALYSCPLEYALSSIYKWAPAGNSDALDFGRLWHFVLEAYYRAMQAQQQLGKSRTPFDAAADVLLAFEDEEGYEDFFNLGVKMLERYAEEYKWEKDRLEIIDIELALDVRMKPEAWKGFPTSSIFDLIIVDHSVGRKGALRAIEHKGLSRLDSSAIDGYHLDDQILGQDWLLQNVADLSDYPPFLGVTVSITTKTKETGFMRIPVTHSLDVLQNYEDNKRYWWLQSQNEWPKANYPRNYGSCVRRWSKCQFFDYCRVRPQQTFAQIRQKDTSPPPGYTTRTW